jgi:hypothetical protein
MSEVNPSTLSPLALQDIPINANVITYSNSQGKQRPERHRTKKRKYIRSGTAYQTKSQFDCTKNCLPGKTSTEKKENAAQGGPTT